MLLFASVSTFFAAMMFQNVYVVGLGANVSIFEFISGGKKDLKSNFKKIFI